MLFSNFLCVVKPDNNMTSGVQEIESWKAHYSKSSTVTRGSLSSLWSILQEFHCIIQIHSGSYCSLTPLWWMMDEISIGWFLHPVVGWNLKDWSSDVCMSELGTFLQPNETWNSASEILTGTHPMFSRSSIPHLFYQRISKNFSLRIAEWGLSGR